MTLTRKLTMTGLWRVTVRESNRTSPTELPPFACANH